MKLLKTFGCLLLMFFAYDASAHALWVKTAAVGKKGTQHEVQVYFAEPGQQREPVEGEEWRMVKGFDLWVISPSGKESRLELKAQSDFYSTTFIPREEGLYRVLLKHEKIGVLTFDKAAPFVPYFYASANVWVGNEAGITDALLPGRDQLPVSIVPVVKKGTSKVFFHISSPEGLQYQVTVFSPSGTVTKLEAGKKGQAAFDAAEPGDYQAELSAVDTKPGTIGGKEYKKAYHVATATFEIK